jgi:phage I-like protein
MIESSIRVAAVDRESHLARIAAAELDGAVPERVLVAPWGEVASTSGSFVVDADAGAAVIAAFAAHGTDLPIDFEHQTLGGSYASPQGTAPAAGWIMALELVAGEGIVATVNWTEEGRRMLASRAYRYLSPVALIRQDDRRLVALHSVALTNKPAIVGMKPVVNRESVMEEPVEASQPNGEPASGDLGDPGMEIPTVNGAGAVVAALSARLALAPETDAMTLLAAAEARLAALEDAARRQEADGLVAAAQAAGKLTPAQREWAFSLAMKDRRLFAAWARSAPVVVATGRIAAPAGGAVVGEGARAALARSEYRASRTLQALTSEDAYVAEALRP